MNDLIEATIKTGQGLGDMVGCCRVRCRGGRNSTRVHIALRHALELVSQGVETLVDGGEIFADVVVVIRFPV